MKRVLGRIIALIAASHLTGCAPSEDNSDPSAIKVVAPMSDSNSNYKLDTTILTGVEDLQSLSGQYARFFMSPKIENNKLVGESPKTRFIRNAHGEYVPGNSMTQQMVAIYAHLERLAHLDVELGAVGVNTWPRDVGMSVKVRGGNENNAFYDGQSDSMLFVPYNQEGLAIPINGGIIAHEHFHSLFYKMVLKDTEYRLNAHEVSQYFGVEQPQTPVAPSATETPQVNPRRIQPVVSRPFDRNESKIESEQIHKYYHIVIARALNEGLADFWGWMYTGDPDFIAQSLPQQKLDRSLHTAEAEALSSLTSPAEIKRFLRLYYSTGATQQMNAYAVGFAYSIASKYSRVMKRFTDIYAESRQVPALEARKHVAKLLVKIMPLMQKDLVSLNGRYYTSVDFLKTLLSQLEDLKERECSYLELVANNSEDTKTYTCQAGEKGWTLVASEVKTETPSPEKSVE